MNLQLVIYFVLVTTFSSRCQPDTITFVHNKYEFQTDIKTILDYLLIATDSIDTYTNRLREINSSRPKFDSDSILPILGDHDLRFSDILLILESNHRLVKIKRTSDSQFIRFKVKTIKKRHPSYGIGESSETILIIIDKKYRKEIVLEVVRRNLAC